jgi:hypothetical protein
MGASAPRVRRQDRRRGESNIPFLLERLRAERDEVRQAQIIYIFLGMASSGHLHGKQDVIAELEQVISQMGFGFAKADAEEYLEEIKDRARI